MPFHILPTLAWARVKNQGAAAAYIARKGLRPLWILVFGVILALLVKLRLRGTKVAHRVAMPLSGRSVRTLGALAVLRPFFIITNVGCIKLSPAFRKGDPHRIRREVHEGALPAGCYPYTVFA